MKAAGVGTCMPIWEAMGKCPDGVKLKRDFRWYEVLSRLMLGVMWECSQSIEYLSISEFLFDAAPPRGRTPEEFAATIRDRIWERVGVPVTVGVARSRTLAKLISDSAKPFGVRAALGRAEKEALLADRPVTEVTGITGRQERRLQPWGIASCLDLARADRRLIRNLPTATGEALWWELNGEAVLPIRPERPLHEALSRGGSFGEPAARPLILWAWAERNLERLIEELHS